MLSIGRWFLAVSSIQYREGFIRDAFIKGSNSQGIRQRFFWNILHRIISQNNLQLNYAYFDNKTIGRTGKDDNDENI